MFTKAYNIGHKMLAMADKLYFSEWLESEMEKRHLSQADLARKAGVTRAAINGVLTGSRGPGTDLCIAIAKAFTIAPETVYRAAGLLPPEPESSERIEEALYVLGQLDPEDVDEIIEIARLKLARKGGPPPATPPTQKLRKSRKPAAPPL